MGSFSSALMSETLPQAIVCNQRRRGCCGAQLARQGALPGARGLTRVGDVAVPQRDTQALDSLQSCCVSLGKVKEGSPATSQTWHLG